MGWLADDSCLLRNNMCDLPAPDAERGRAYQCEACGKVWAPMEGFRTAYWEELDG